MLESIPITEYFDHNDSSVPGDFSGQIQLIEAAVEAGNYEGVLPVSQFPERVLQDILRLIPLVDGAEEMYIGAYPLGELNGSHHNQWRESYGSASHICSRAGYFQRFIRECDGKGFAIWTNPPDVLTLSCVVRALGLDESQLVELTADQEWRTHGFSGKGQEPDTPRILKLD